MFNANNSKSSNNENKKIEDKVAQDFVTHNMPAPHRFSGQTFSTGETKSDTAIAISSAEDHRKIGLLIIGGGLILIIALFYFGYSYFIKPMITQPEVMVENNDKIIETPVEDIAPV